MRRFLLAATLCLVIGLLGGLLTLAVGPSAAPARYRFVPPRETAFDFNLKDQDGKSQSIAAARGKVLAITFLFSTCHDLCPAEANLMGAAAEKVGDGVLVYGVSVDPTGTRPSARRRSSSAAACPRRPSSTCSARAKSSSPSGARYGIAPVNATPEDAIAAAEATDKFLAAAAARGEKLGRRPYEPPKRDAPEDAGDPYPDPDDLSYRGRSRHEQGLDFEHSAYVMLIDKHGRQRVGIPFEQLTVEGLAADLEALKREP